MLLVRTLVFALVLVLVVRQVTWQNANRVPDVSTIAHGDHQTEQAKRSALTEASPAPVFLDVSSMWAIGADARMPLIRRTRIPLVTWTAEAVEHVERAWRSVQFRRTCDQTLYTYAYKWGITSQMRDYSDLVMVGALAFNRTLMLVEDAPRPKWCAENMWLGCFFKPLDGGRCKKTATDLIGVRAIRAWPVPGGTENIATALSTRTKTLQLRNVSRFVGIVNDTSLLPHKLWQELLDGRYVQVHDSYGNAVDMNEYKLDRPSLYHTLAVSALRSILSGIIFRPQDNLMNLIRQRAVELKRHHRHCVAVHLRWTDKTLDGGLATVINGTTRHVISALDRVERRTGRSYQCLLILSDDDENALRALGASLGDTYELIRVSQVHTLFHTEEEYEIYRRKGHEFMIDKTDSDPDLAYAYYDAVLIDVYAAAEAADYLIGVGTSGVSQLLSQLIGAKRRADGNAFTVWQEDVLVQTVGLT